MVINTTKREKSFFIVLFVLWEVGSKRPVGINIQKAWNLTFAYSLNRGTGNFLTYPKQEGSKRPLGYDYPAAERPCVDCSVWWHFIFGVGVACLFL